MFFVHYLCPSIDVSFTEADICLISYNSPAPRGKKKPGKQLALGCCMNDDMLFRIESARAVWFFLIFRFSLSLHSLALEPIYLAPERKPSSK